MTIQELIDLAGKQQTYVLIAFAVPPVLSILIRILHGSGKGPFAPWKHIYSLIVYLSAIPGVFAAVLLFYNLFFLKANLLRVNAVIYFVPILSMILTFVIISRFVSFNQLPGFQRLRGLMFMIAASFAIVLIIDKMRIWVAFHGSIFWLFLLAAGIFILLKLGAHKLWGKKSS